MKLLDQHEKHIDMLFEKNIKIKISRNRKCNNQIYDFLGTILELDEDDIC